MRPGPATSTPSCCPSSERVSGCRAPRHPGHPRQPRLLDGGGGDAAGARDQFAALLPIRERVLGAEHPDTLTTRANLAYWAGQA